MFLEFVAQYWYLFLAFGALLLLLMFDIFKGDALGIKSIDPTIVAQLQSREDAQIIDVRDKDQFKAGHIASAINIPFNEFENSLNKIKKFRDKPIIVCCQLGRDSFKAAGILQKNDFTAIHYLKGGIDSWKHDNLPLVNEK